MTIKFNGKEAKTPDEYTLFIVNDKVTFHVAKDEDGNIEVYFPYDYVDVDGDSVKVNAHAN